MKIIQLPQNVEEFIARLRTFGEIHGLKMLGIVLGGEPKAMELSGDLSQEAKESIADLIQ